MDPSSPEVQKRIHSLQKEAYTRLLRVVCAQEPTWVRWQQPRFVVRKRADVTLIRCSDAPGLSEGYRDACRKRMSSSPTLARC